MQQLPLLITPPYLLSTASSPHISTEGGQGASNGTHHCHRVVGVIWLGLLREVWATQLPLRVMDHQSQFIYCYTVVLNVCNKFPCQSHLPIYKALLPLPTLAHHFASFLGVVPHWYFLNFLQPKSILCHWRLLCMRSCINHEPHVACSKPCFVALRPFVKRSQNLCIKDKLIAKNVCNRSHIP